MRSTLLNPGNRYQNEHNPNGALIPPSKNLYYQMKHQLDQYTTPISGSTSDKNLIKSQVIKLNQLYRESDSITQDNKQQLSQTNFFRKSQAFNSTQGSLNPLSSGKGIFDKVRKPSLSFTPQEPLQSTQYSNYPSNGASIDLNHPHYKLYKNGVKVTLGNNPVKFGRKVYLQSNTPQCTHSKIPIPGNTNPLGLEMFLDDQNINLMPRKKRLSPIQSPKKDLLIIDTDNHRFNPKQHENYFNDFFGFKDKGKKQLNDGFPIVEKLNREYNIVNNDVFLDKAENKKSETYFKETKAQLNTENRYFLPSKVDSIRNSVERITNFHKQVMSDQKYLERIMERNNQPSAGGVTMKFDKSSTFKNYRSIDPKNWR
eukprot:403357678